MDTPPSGAAWGELLKQYDAYMRAAGRSAGTIRLHRYKVLDLAERVARPGDVTEQHLLEVLANPSWKAETRRSTRSCFRSFFGWAAKKGHLEQDPSADLPTVPVPAAEPRPTPPLVLRRSLRDAEPRERFMLLLGAAAGLRASEIARVHEHHWDGERLTVLGKGGKLRHVNVGDPTLIGLLDELRGYAFPNRWTGEPITAGHVSKLLSLALAETWTGHTLRHRYGTVTLAATKDLLAVGQQMGHSRPETTQRYCQVDEDRRRAVGAAAAVA